MDIWYDVDANLAEVPVNILPLISSSDFVTIQGAVAYDAAGMALFWHFVTTAGAYTLTAVTPTTGGNYDWTDQGAAGIYTIEIPASGGASANNDTEGFGWFTGSATGVLPWRGPVCGFRAAALNNSLIDAGTTGLLAPTTAARTLDVTATGGAGIDWSNVEAPTTALDLSGTTVAITQKVDVNTIKTNAVVNAGTITFPTTATLASTTNITGGTVTTATNVTTVNGFAANVITAAATAADFSTEVNAAVLAILGTPAGASMSADIAAIKVVVDLVNGFLDDEIALILAAVDMEVAAIKVQTDKLTFTVANVVDANIQRINDVTVLGDGSGTPWGP